MGVRWTYSAGRAGMKLAKAWISSTHEQSIVRMRMARNYMAHLLPFNGVYAQGALPASVRHVLAVAVCVVVAWTITVLLCATVLPESAWASQAAGAQSGEVQTEEADAGEAGAGAVEAPSSDHAAADGSADGGAAEDGGENASDTEGESEDKEGSEASVEVDLPDNVVNARQTADNSFLYDTSVYELVQADATMQGATVQIVGEVIGDAIHAEEDADKAWITLEAIEDDYESSISVLVDDKFLGLIDTYGGYNRKGTTLQVRGTFYLACPSHEGIIDIHAETVTLVARGNDIEDVFDIERFVPGLVLCGIGGALALLYRYLRERER